MLQDPLTLYKLIVLYMLNRVTFPLGRTGQRFYPWKGIHELPDPAAGHQ